MKEFFLKLLSQKKEARDALKAKGKASASIEEVRSIAEQVEKIDQEIVEARAQLETIEAEERAAVVATTNMSAAGNKGEGLETRSAGSPVGAAMVVNTYGAASSQNQSEPRNTIPEDPFGTLEYRHAFMDFARAGKITPELRIDAMTSTTDVTAVIPTTILNEVIKKVTVYGQVYARVRKLSVKGGVTIPILSLAPTATWIGETSTSDKQKIQANTNITFAYYGLECKVAVSLLADTATLASFENTIIELITEAMIKAIDAAVISGDGSGKCEGITHDTRVPAGQIITLSSADFDDWSAWKKNVFAKMPLAYKAGAAFLMASGTFEGYIDGMVDANGQPVGRINYGITDGPQERFGGKEVIQVEDDIIANYDDASTGDVVAIYCNLKNYGFNSNMQMTMFRYFDHDTNEWVDKAILIADGKLIDPNGVVIIKKGA